LSQQLQSQLLFYGVLLMCLLLLLLPLLVLLQLLQGAF